MVKNSKNKLSSWHKYPSENKLLIIQSTLIKKLEPHYWLAASLGAPISDLQSASGGIGSDSPEKIP